MGPRLSDTHRHVHGSGQPQLLTIGDGRPYAKSTRLRNQVNCFGAAVTASAYGQLYFARIRHLFGILGRRPNGDRDCCRL